MLRLNGVLHFRKGLLDSGMLNELWGALDQGGRLSLISGPCAIESEELCLEVGEFLRQECAALGVTYIFKARCSGPPPHRAIAPNGSHQKSPGSRIVS